MKFYCVKCRVTREVPEGKYEDYVPANKDKALKMKKANRSGYKTKCATCGTGMYTFRTNKKSVSTTKPAK